MRATAAQAIKGLLVATALLWGCSRPSEPSPSAEPAAPSIAAGPGAAPVDGPTLAAIKTRGRVGCGVVENLPGFASRDLLGQWRGFDIDFCRAVAAAVFGDARLIRIVPMDTRARLNALQAGQIDLIPRGSWTYTRDAGLGLDVVAVSYYDNQGFMVRRALERAKVGELRGASICVQAGTTNAANLVDYFRDTPQATRPQTILFDTADEALAAYRDGQCQILSGSISTLSSQRTTLRDAGDHVVLAEVIAKDPMGPVVRQNDPQWADIVRWTLNAMILSEELGVSSQSAPTERERPRTGEVQNLLTGDGYGSMLLLGDDWAYQVIRQVGSYGEIFDRNLGPDTPLGLLRGENALWNAESPGLLYSPPMR